MFAPFKILTVRQPHASMIAGRLEGWDKTIEVRSKPTSYRGSVLICAGLADAEPDSIPDGFTWSDQKRRDAIRFPRGVALCFVDLRDCLPMRPDDWAEACTNVRNHHFGWHLTRTAIVEPIKVTGQLGLKPPQQSVLDALGQHAGAGFAVCMN